jgi:hypothetical protein
MQVLDKADPFWTHTCRMIHRTTLKDTAGYHLKTTAKETYICGSSTVRLKNSYISANLILDVYYTLPQGRQET